MILPRLTPAVLCLFALAAVTAPAIALPALQVAPAADGSHTAITAKDGQPLVFADRGTGSIAVPAVPAAEGTLAFFFTPDWSPGDCTTHWLFELKGEGFQVAFRKGYNHAISPDYCYLFKDPGGGTVGFHPENLFRGRERRHFAIRWSVAKNRIQFVADGEASGRAGTYKYEGPAQIPGILTLYGMACGKFEDMRLYPKYLTVPEILPVGGLKEPARYLQSQPPPTPRPGTAGVSPAVPGAGGTPALPREYIDPHTGQLVQTLEDDQAELQPAYNPAAYPDLPATPHTKWARPLAGGKLRVLMVATHGFYDEYSMIREAAELWQRLECDILVTHKPDPRVMSQDFDVIAVSLQGFTNGRWAGWADLDPKLRGWILDRVKGGQSGLVWAYPTQPDDAINKLATADARQPASDLLRGAPVEALMQANTPDGKGAFRWDKVYTLDPECFLTAEQAEALVEVYAVGGRDGRAPGTGAPPRRFVKLNYKNASWNPNMGLTPDTALNPAATDALYDQWMAVAARAMLLAAGREPASRIVSADVSGAAWSVRLQGADASRLKLSAGARDLWGRTLVKPVTVAGATTVSIKGVKLPPRAFAEFILRDADGKVVDWFSAAAPVPTDPQILTVTLDREFYAKGQTVKGEVAAQAGQPQQCALEVFLTDHEGRRVRRGECGKLINGRAFFTVTIPPSTDSLLMRIEALLSSNNALVDLRAADVPVPELTPSGFYPIMYGTPLNRQIVRARKRLLRDEFGVRGGFHQGSHSWANLASLNLASVEYSGHLGYPMKQSDCEDFAENWDQNVTQWLMGPPDKMIPYRPIFYSLGEEHFVLLSACPTPTANAKFREWLQGKYGTLERLNTVWGAKFATWDDIQMMTPEIVDMLKIQFDVVRFENRRFMEHLFAERHAFLAEYLRKVTASGPDAATQPHTGIHAGWDLWMGRGYDYWLLSRAMEDMMCYGGPHNHYARSFFQRYYGSHYHYNIGSHDNVRWHPWSMLLSGAQGVSWYTDAPQIWGATMADLHLTGDWLAAADEFKSVADLGQLLTRARYMDDGIAIHYSQDSFQAGVSDLTWMHQRFINLCFDTGTPFRFVSYAQVEQGDLLRRRPKLLVLPHSVALSEAECKAVREYVAGGGVLWADVMPGTYSNFGQKLEQSQLADLFTGMQEAELETGGKIARKSVGKGQVVLADPGNYSYDRNVGQHYGGMELLARLTELAGVQQVASVTQARDARPANGIWTAGWQNGGALHVALCKDYQLADRLPVQASIHFARSGHIYEARSGKYFGMSDVVLASLKPTTGQVFSILPYRVNALSLQPVGQPARGQDLVIRAALRTQGQVGKNDLHVLQVRVSSPGGEENYACRRTVEMRGGTHSLSLPVAHNDDTGRWTITVRDLATGVTAQTTVQVK